MELYRAYHIIKCNNKKCKNMMLKLLEDNGVKMVNVERIGDEYEIRILIKDSTYNK